MGICTHIVITAVKLINTRSPPSPEFFCVPDPVLGSKDTKMKLAWLSSFSGPNEGNKTFEQVSHYPKRPAPHWKIRKLRDCPTEEGPWLEERSRSWSTKKKKIKERFAHGKGKQCRDSMTKAMGSTEPDLLRDSELFFLTCELRKVFLWPALCENLQRGMEVGLRKVS